MISAAETGGPIHIDAECVLYGEIAFVPLEPPLMIAGLEIGPPSVIRMAGVTIVLVLLVLVFYKELLLTSFDPALARSMGVNAGFWHYALMTALSIVVVSSFEAVGAILAVAMLIVPAMFAAQLSFHLPTRFLLTALHSAVSSLLGFHLAVWLGCSTAAAMVVVGAFLFLAAWGLTSIRRKPRLFEGFDQKASAFDPAQGWIPRPNPE
jgi:manganese/zinc/iron transport system permease protein